MLPCSVYIVALLFLLCQQVQKVKDILCPMKYGQFSLEKQPVYTAHNFYADGVAAYEKDGTSVKTSAKTNARIVTEKDGVYLEIDIDPAFDKIKAERVDTQRLGVPRLTELPYDAPDGSFITVSEDMLGRSRGAHPTTGAIEGLCAGFNRILIAKNK